MIDLAFWVAYLAAAAVALAMVRYKGVTLFLSILAGTAVGLLLSLLVLLAVPSEDRSPWFQVELAVNGSLAMIFAGAGAALGFAVKTSRE